MTLDEAKSQMTALRAEYDELWGTLPQEGGQPGMEPGVAETEKSGEMRRFGELCAGYPHIRPYLWCWMVDVHGSEESGLTDGEQANEAFDLLMSGKQDEFLGRVGGALAQQVSRFIADELHLHSTDGGGGCGGWHIGTPCNDAECHMLTASLHTRFAKAIAAGLLRVTVKFWGWKFRTEEKAE